MVELIETHTHDWWVLVDRRVVSIHLQSPGLVAWLSAAKEADELSEGGDWVVHSLETLSSALVISLVLGERSVATRRDAGRRRLDSSRRSEE